MSCQHHVKVSALLPYMCMNKQTSYTICAQQYNSSYKRDTFIPMSSLSYCMTCIVFSSILWCIRQEMQCSGGGWVLTHRFSCHHRATMWHMNGDASSVTERPWAVWATGGTDRNHQRYIGWNFQFLFRGVTFCNWHLHKRDSLTNGF